MFIMAWPAWQSVASKMDTPEYKIEIIKTDIPQIQITPNIKESTPTKTSTTYETLCKSLVFKSWILPDEDPNLVKCKFCPGKSYNIEKLLLMKHMNTPKHKLNVKRASDLNLKLTCRTCLAKLSPKEVTSLFKVDRPTCRSYNQIVRYVTGIYATPMDRLPKDICNSCKVIVLNAYNFQLQVKRADAILQKRYGTAENNKPKVESQVSKEPVASKEPVEIVEEIKKSNQETTEELKVNKKETDLESSVFLEVTKSDTTNVLDVTKSDTTNVLNVTKSDTAKVEVEIDKVDIELFPERTSVNKTGDSNTKIEESKLKREVTRTENKYDQDIIGRSDDSIADPDYVDYLDSDSDDSTKNTTVQSKPKNTVHFAPRECLTCHSTFTSQKVLRRHMDTCKKPPHKVKPPLRANQCRLCFKSFNNALLLLHHVRTTHRNLIDSKPKQKTARANLAKKQKPMLNRWISKESFDRVKGVNRCRIPIVNVGEAQGYRPPQTKKVKPVTKKEAPPPPNTRCGVCSAIFKTELELDEHCRDHGSTEVIMCGLCQKVYYAYPQFKRHFGVHHPDLETIVNADTTETVVEIEDTLVLEQILQHVRVTSIGDLITANIPPTDEPMEIEAYVQVCGLCGCVLLSPEEFDTHNKTEHLDYNLRCQFCAMLFINEQALKFHVNRCRITEKKLECLICGQRMLRESEQVRHISAKHPEKYDRWLELRKKMRNFVCEVCGRAFSLRVQLNVHRHTCEPEMEVQCEICNKTFLKKYLLQRHIQNAHERPPAERHLLCSYCGKSFLRRGQMEIHVRTHTGERPYKCTIEGCDKAFITSHSLLYHHRKHRGDSPHVCEICNKRFLRGKSLTLHMMIHTGERPHKCNKCDAAFIQPQCLTQHMKKHYTNEPSLILDPEPFKKVESVSPKSHEAYDGSELVVDETDAEYLEEVEPSIPRRRIKEQRRTGGRAKRRRYEGKDWCLPILD